MKEDELVKELLDELTIKRYGVKFKDTCNKRRDIIVGLAELKIGRHRK